MLFATLVKIKKIVLNVLPQFKSYLKITFFLLIKNAKLKRKHAYILCQEGGKTQFGVFLWR